MGTKHNVLLTVGSNRAGYFIDFGNDAERAYAALKLINGTDGLSADELRRTVAGIENNVNAELETLRADNALLRALAQHIEAMATDAHFCEHPEWHEIVAESRAALAQSGKVQS